MFSIEQKDRIEEKFKIVFRQARYVKRDILNALEGCNEEEALCLQYLYAYMPRPDMGDYSGELFLQFTRHALKVRDIMPWGRMIETDLFLNYVLQYRINNENIEFYSECFFEEIYERIKNCTMYEAAVEVNYWCFEKATYRSTDDRTASPLTVVKNAFGRCGEESTLAVAALRSVGIPARQCYTPRWAHCDDNHAWVEVWIDGTWHFMGACEPDPRLDTGWFRLPASRGMLVHNRVFSDMAGEERITKRMKRMTEITILHHYADTKMIKIRVINEEGTPLAGVKVHFEVVNYAEFYPLTILKTSSKGEVSFETGLGDLMIYAHDSESYFYEKIDVRKEDFLELVLSNTPQKNPEFIDFALVPPVGGIEEESPLTKEAKMAAQIRHEKAAERRKAYEGSFFHKDRAEEYAAGFETDREQIAECLIGARGNYEEIIRFLEDEETKEFLGYKVKMLTSLPKKDLTDCQADILSDHLICAMPFRHQYEEEVFVPYLLCPRIHMEMMTAYRSAEIEYFAEEAIELFREEPQRVFEYVEEIYKTYDDSGYADMISSPEGILRYRKANALSKKVFLVSILRTLGLPARMDKADGRVCCYLNGEWNYFLNKNAEQADKTAVLRLRQEEGEENLFAYYRNYTVSYLKEGAFLTLDLENIAWKEGAVTYELEPGTVRIVTADRQQDGTNLVRSYYRELERGEMVEVQLTLLKGERKSMEVEIPERPVFTLDGRQKSFTRVISGRNAIVAWLQVGAEPTEHLLNEIIEAGQKLKDKKINLIMVIKKPEDYEDVTLQKAIQSGISMEVVLEPDRFDLDAVYQAFHIKDKKLPLAVTMNSGNRAAHAFYGYQVGIGEMLIKNIQKKE